MWLVMGYVCVRPRSESGATRLALGDAGKSAVFDKRRLVPMLDNQG